ncbi:MAG: hypothetical protein KGL53_09095, partial [Elusimicrobia bacterium]|nr:hypothetical protein [Elusimicrobiota bacterium]
MKRVLAACLAAVVAVPVPALAQFRTAPVEGRAVPVGASLAPAGALTRGVLPAAVLPSSTLSLPASLPAAAALPSAAFARPGALPAA